MSFLEFLGDKEKYEKRLKQYTKTKADAAEAVSRMKAEESRLEKMKEELKMSIYDFSPSMSKLKAVREQLDYRDKMLNIDKERISNIRRETNVKGVAQLAFSEELKKREVDVANREKNVVSSFKRIDDREASLLMKEKKIEECLKGIK